MSHELALPLIMVFSVGSLFVAGYLMKWVLKRDTGTSAMQAISNAIKEGAEAFLRRQNTTITILALVLAVVIFILYAFVRDHHDFDPVPTALGLAFWTTLSFVLGAACSVVAGYVGMWISIRANIRTASAARTSLNDALRTALRGGAVSGLFVVAMSLFGVGGLYWLVSKFTAVSPAHIPAPDRRLRLRRLVRRPLRPARRRHLHEGRRRRRGPRRQGRGRHSRGRPAQPGRHRRPRRRQRRRLRRPRGRPLRVDGGREHRRHDPRRHARGGAREAGHGFLGRNRRRDAVPPGRPRVRPARLDRRHLPRQDARGRRPDGGPEPRLLHHLGARDRRILRGHQVAALQPGASRRMVEVLPLRHHRRSHLGRLRLHHAVLHRVQVPAGPRDRRGIPDRSRDQHHRGHLDRHRVHPRARHRDLGRDPGLVQDRRLGAAGRRPLRNCRRHDGHARHGRVHPRDGHVRPDHGQRGRHRRDVAAARGDPEEDRSPRRGRQHDEGADEGLCHRLRRARGVPALLGVPRRAQELRRGADLGQPRQAGGLRRRPHRRDARFLLLRSRHQGRRARPPTSSSRTSARSSRSARASCRAPRSPTTGAPSTS